MKGIDWDKLLRKEVNPPFKPFYSKSNFDAEYTAMDPILEDDEPLVALDNEEEPKQT